MSELTTTYSRKESAKLLSKYPGFCAPVLLQLLVKSKTQDQFVAKVMAAYSPIKNVKKLANGQKPLAQRAKALGVLSTLKKALTVERAECFEFSDSMKVLNGQSRLELISLVAQLEQVVPGLKHKLMTFDWAALTSN